MRPEPGRGDDDSLPFGRWGTAQLLDRGQTRPLSSSSRFRQARLDDARPPARPARGRRPACARTSAPCRTRRRRRRGRGPRAAAARPPPSTARGRIARASSSGSSGGTSQPVAAGMTLSASAPWLVTITGLPIAWAAAASTPDGSGRVAGRTTTSASAQRRRQVVGVAAEAHPLAEARLSEQWPAAPCRRRRAGRDRPRAATTQSVRGRRARACSSSRWPRSPVRRPRHQHHLRDPRRCAQRSASARTRWPRTRSGSNSSGSIQRRTVRSRAGSTTPRRRADRRRSPRRR